MEQLAQFLMMALATWGLSFGLVYKDGAFGIMKKIRARAGKESWSPFHCLFCTSVWVGLVFAYFFSPAPLLYWFALAGASLLIDKIHDRLMLDL